MKHLGFLIEKHPGHQHYELFYELRGQPGVGIHGLRDPKVLSTYEESIQRTLEFLITSLSLPEPSSKIPIYVFEIGEVFPGECSPFTDSGEDRNPYVALPCRNDAPTKEEEYRHAAAAACHEMFHAVAWKRRPLRALMSRPWRWFHEGCAVWTEMQVLPGNIDYLRYGLDWCDYPDLPLDDDRMLYQSGFFVRYLAQRLPGIIGRVWTNDDTKKTPLDIVSQEAPWDKLFADYCRESFFPVFAPEVFERFGQRAVEEVIQLDGSAPVAKEGHLSHLCCRYYVLRAKRRPAARLLKGDEPIGFELVSAPPETDRWLVVVSNSGRDSSHDALPYEIEVSSA